MGSNMELSMAVCGVHAMSFVSGLKSSKSQTSVRTHCKIYSWFYAKLDSDLVSPHSMEGQIVGLMFKKPNCFHFIERETISRYLQTVSNDQWDSSTSWCLEFPSDLCAWVHKVSCLVQTWLTDQVSCVYAASVLCESLLLKSDHSGYHMVQ